MFSNLWSRFGLILLIVLMSLGIVSVYPLRKGIDLAGGIDLVYELDYSQMSPNVDRNQMAKDVITVLRGRVDPNGLKNLTWRPIAGGDRIEIQMPLPSEETKQARKEYSEAQAKLAAMNLRMTDINAALAHDPARRKAEFDKMAAEGSPRRVLLDTLAKAYDDRAKGEAEMAKYPSVENIPGEILAATNTARASYNQAVETVEATNVDMVAFNDLLEATDDPKNVNAAKQLDELPGKYPVQSAQITNVIKSYQDLREHKGGGFDDPADLQRLLRGKGVLDFRIAVTGNEDPALINRALEQIRTVGPSKAQLANAKWYEIDPKNGADLVKEGHVVIEAWGSGHYILLHTEPGKALYHSEPYEKWQLTDPRQSVDPMSGKLVVDFRFDPAGALYFGRLTSNNKQLPMAILLDDKALTAPNINDAITNGACQITFGSASAAEVSKQAEILVNMLKAGSLPAAVKPDPVSNQTIGSELGKDNIDKGLRSGIYAVIGVMAFMVLYYTLTGAFADLAVMINLLMTLAAMAMLGATFTLPGIAGIVLTLGMAVDANVLINERIREEVHKGASLWMAVRQGYDKVFWTIFDANTTTSLTSIVLIFVASEEVKGFGVTLLIGLMVHMFTALFVTRTLMIAAIKWGVLKQIDDHSVAEYIREVVTLTWLRQGRWPFMRVVTVTNFDWIGKRHIFWAVSALVTVAGIVAFLARGSDKYDTEFNGGTQLTFQLRSVTDIGDVRKQVSEELSNELKADSGKAASPEWGKSLEQMSRDMQQARIAAVGSDGKTFQLVTTISDPAQSKELKERLARKLGDNLDIRKQLTYRGSDLPEKPSYETLNGQHLVYPITDTSLEKNIEGVSAAELGDNDVSPYLHGAAIVLDNISPPTTVEEITGRLTAMRQKDDFRKAQYRESKVIPVAYAAGEKPGPTARLSKAVIVVVDPVIGYAPEAADSTWNTDVAVTEWNLATQALTKESSWRGESRFDAAVAASAQGSAILSIIISLGLIVIYVWIRFGGLRYGIGAILSLLHDAIVAVAATVLSGELVIHARGVADALLIGDFKINLTMVAAYLTIIGYSVNDTIVIFDRIRENRGKGTGPLSAKLVNDSINQCFGRTIWTTFTVFMVVLIMYIWGGEGVRGFAFAMLIGVITGAYSTLAIAAPALLNIRERAKAAPVKLLSLDEPAKEGDLMM